MKTDDVHALAAKAASCQDSKEALEFSQAALNIAQAITSLHYAGESARGIEAAAAAEPSGQAQD